VSDDVAVLDHRLSKGLRLPLDLPRLSAPRAPRIRYGVNSLSAQSTLPIAEDSEIILSDAKSTTVARINAGGQVN